MLGLEVSPGAAGRDPNIGSAFPAEVTGIDDLRARRVDGFPCGWFYFVMDRYIDVVRLLHDAQDLPMSLAGLEPE